MPEFLYRSAVAVSPEELFAWHSRDGAFERLKPPWEHVKIVQRRGTIRDGDRIVVANRMGPVWVKWVAEHRDYLVGRQFRDVQLTGPFASWQHTHRMLPDGSGSSVLEDRIHYRLPLGRVGNLVAGKLVTRKLTRLFAYRHRITAADLDLHKSWKGERHMRIAVTGSTGLVGSALIPFLTTGGHQVVRLVRTKPASDSGQIFWDPATGQLNPDDLEGLDAVVHLAGENIAAGRWTEGQKKRIRDSRVQGTELLSNALASLKSPPKVLVSASAIGYYGDRGEEILAEESPPGSGFLSQVCQAWEAATATAANKGIRVVNLRIGVVLSPEGGALAKMLPPFKMGVGGIVGSGNQFWSWIALDDLVGVIHHALATESLHGPVNAVSPNPVRNREFTRVLGRVVSRPTLFPLPAFAARLALGEMADELLLASARLEPLKLKQSGYRFRYPDLEAALRHLLGK